MGNIKKVMEKTAPALGLKYDAKRLVVYGNHRGFTTVIQLLQQSNNVPKVWISLMTATAQGTPLSGFEILGAVCILGAAVVSELPGRVKKM